MIQRCHPSDSVKHLCLARDFVEDEEDSHGQAGLQTIKKWRSKKILLYSTENFSFHNKNSSTKIVCQTFGYNTFTRSP